MPERRITQTDAILAHMERRGIRICSAMRSHRNHLGQTIRYAVYTLGGD